MDHQSEQNEEIEVITSIYPEEITTKSPTDYAISVDLDVPSDRKHKLALRVQYPETYPEVVPDIQVGYATSILYEMLGEDYDEDEEEVSDDDEDDEDSVKPLLLAETIDFSHQNFDFLKQKLLEEAEMSLGMPVVFTLVSQLKIEAEALFEQILAEKQREYDEKEAQREREEQKKFRGTPVTKESFAKWRQAFREEMRLDQYFEERAREMHGGKLSGREIFERGLEGDEE